MIAKIYGLIDVGFEEDDEKIKQLKKVLKKAGLYVGIVDDELPMGIGEGRVMYISTSKATVKQLEAAMDSYEESWR